MKFDKRKYHGLSGELYYELGEFFVTKGFNGTWHILKREPWYVTDAYEVDDCFLFKLEPFPSFIRAVAYLKANINNLI